MLSYSLSHSPKRPQLKVGTRYRSVTASARHRIASLGYKPTYNKAPALHRGFVIAPIRISVSPYCPERTDPGSIPATCTNQAQAGSYRMCGQYHQTSGAQHTSSALYTCSLEPPLTPTSCGNSFFPTQHNIPPLSRHVYQCVTLWTDFHKMSPSPAAALTSQRSRRSIHIAAPLRSAKRPNRTSPHRAGAPSVRTLSQ